MSRKEKERKNSQTRYFFSVNEERSRRMIRIAKQMIVTEPPCLSHCVKSPSCSKLREYEEKVREMKELLQPRLDKDVKEARRKLVMLVRECIRLCMKINRCIYIHRDHLTLKEGYNFWIE